MPLITLDDATRAKKMRRALTVGAPNTYKTTSLATWPKPIFLLSYPGEQGVGAIPKSPDITVVIGERTATESAKEVWDAIFKLTGEVVTGKKGSFKTFAGDGLYQLAVLALDVVSGGDFSKGVKIDPFLYPQASRLVLHYLQQVMDSDIPYAVFTTWEGKETADALANAKSDAKRVLYPGLPGALAKDIMGYFSVVLYAELETVTGGTVGKWRLTTTQDIRAAGIKLPVEVAKRLPSTIKQDFSILEPLLLGSATAKEVK